MMSIWAVMIKDSYGNRWIDSLWVNKYAFQHGAEERVSTLKRVIEAMDAKHAVWVIEMKLEDGALTGSPEPEVAAHFTAETAPSGEPKPEAS